MGNKIIDDVEELASLPSDELTELLLDSKYNNANLRELIRRLIRSHNNYKRAFSNEKHERITLEKRNLMLTRKISFLEDELYNDKD